MADLDLDAILIHFGIPDVPPTEELDTIDRLVAEVRRLRSENTALRALVARFYTQAWEDPLTDDELALLDHIVNDAMREAE